jgi:hypothetical protein
MTRKFHSNTSPDTRERLITRICDTRDDDVWTMHGLSLFIFTNQWFRALLFKLTQSELAAVATIGNSIPSSSPQRFDRNDRFFHTMVDVTRCQFVFTVKTLLTVVTCPFMDSLSWEPHSLFVFVFRGDLFGDHTPTTRWTTAKPASLDRTQSERVFAI